MACQRWLQPLSTCLIFTIVLAFSGSIASEDVTAEPSPPAKEAIVEISFFDHRNHSSRTMRLKGLFGANSRMASVHSEVVHVRSNHGEHDGCGHIQDWNIPVRKPWIALVVRGECSFEQKIKNLYKNYNATAVVVYDNVDDDLFIINHSPIATVTVLISQHDGELIAELFDNGVVITMRITSETIMIAEHADEEARAQSLANSILRHSRTVLALSLLILAVVGIGFLVLLVQAARVVAVGKRCKGARRDVSKRPFPAMNSAKVEGFGY